MPHRGPRLRPLLVITLAFFWLVAAFAGGYALGQVDALAGKRSAIEALRGVATVLRLKPEQFASQDSTLDADRSRRFKVFWEAWDLLNREFYYRGALDDMAMTYGAIGGLVDSVKDPHTQFSTPEEFKLSQEQLQGRFDGIGVQIDLRDNRLRVVAPLEGSPAERAGVLPGDVIIAVDDTVTVNTTLDQAVKLIR